MEREREREREKEEGDRQADRQRSTPITCVYTCLCSHLYTNTVSIPSIPLCVRAYTYACCRIFATVPGLKKKKKGGGGHRKTMQGEGKNPGAVIRHFTLYLQQ